MKRPERGDCADYFFLYIDQVPDGDVLAVLQAEIETSLRLLRDLPEERAMHRYAEGKWTVKEVVAHMVDTERLFVFRALCFARGDSAALPGMDQDLWCAASGANRRPLDDLMAEFQDLRRSSLRFFRALDDTALAATGTASDSNFKVSAAPWILAGHELHHRKVLTEKYLTA